MTRLQGTAFRLTDQELAILDAAQKRTGMVSRVATLRCLLRDWAKREKIDVNKLKGRRVDR